MPQAKKHCFIDLYKFLLMTGVRIGEALALRWSDVDFEKRVISINKTFMQTVKVKNIIKLQNQNHQLDLCLFRMNY